MLSILKTAEELNVLKEEVETLNKKLAELTEEELEQVVGGADGLTSDMIGFDRMKHGGAVYF